MWMKNCYVVFVPQAMLVPNLLNFEYHFFSRVGLMQLIWPGKSSKPLCLADILHLDESKTIRFLNFRAPQNEK